jgi:hypothetical protein
LAGYSSITEVREANGIAGFFWVLVMKNLSARLGLAVAAILLIVLLGIGLVEEDGQKPEVVADISVPLQAEVDQKIEVVATDKLVVKRPEAEPIKDSPIFMGEPGDHPHPITEEHVDLFEENEIFGEVLGALDVQDLEGLKELSPKYRLHSPEKYVLQNGLDLIINCMSNKTASAIYSAQSYYDTEKASRLRRYVRRFCLE